MWLKEADSRLGEQDRRHSGGCGLNAHAATAGSSSLKELEKRQPASRERCFTSAGSTWALLSGFSCQVEVLCSLLGLIGEGRFHPS